MDCFREKEDDGWDTHFSPVICSAASSREHDRKTAILLILANFTIIQFPSGSSFHGRDPHEDGGVHFSRAVVNPRSPTVALSLSLSE